MGNDFCERRAASAERVRRAIEVSEVNEIVHLNEAEQKLAEFVARKRYESNRAGNVADQKIGPQSAQETDIEGAASEIAFCKLMNVYPDLSTDAHPAHDAVIYPGGRVDVKSTKYKNGRLLAVAGKAGNPADVYALMVGTRPTYRFAGLISAERLLRPEQITDLGYGSTYAANQSDLADLAQWVNDYNSFDNEANK
jgi:hypothetical protein